MYYNIESLEFEDGELIEVIFSRTWYGRCYCTEEVDWDDVDKVVILPCIGEVDKNGKDIYKDDVIRLPIIMASDDPAYGSYFYEGVVKYANGMFYIDSYDDRFQEGFLWNELEIIGNIHEGVSI